MPLPQMPQETPPPSPAPKEIPAQITVPEYQNNLVDTKKYPISSLLTHIEGMSWTVDVYSQLLADGETAMPYQPNQQRPYQQYLTIKGFELKLQGTLAPTANTDTGTMSMSGTARVYPIWRPHVGDVIIADIGDGQVGQFTVTRAERLALYKTATFEIDFTLSRIATQDVIAELEGRVVKRSYFQEDFLVYGQNPVLVDSQLELNQQIDKNYGQILRQWLHSFFSTEYSTMVLPGQNAAVYDPYLIRAALTVFTTDEAPQIQRIKQLNVSGIRPMDDYCVLDALTHADDSYLTPGVHGTGLLPRHSFPPIPLLNGIYFTGISYLVYPKVYEAHVDNDYGTMPPAIASTTVTPINDAQLSLAEVLQDNVEGITTGTPANPIFYSIAYDDGYIFSENFYTNSPTNQSRIELLVRQAISGQKIDTNILFNEVIAARQYFGRIEHFYYDFVILLLLKIAKRQI